MRRRSAVSLIAVGLSFALLAAACSLSDSKNRSSAAGEAGDPTALAALPAGAGSGELRPLYFGAVVTPSSWVSTSLSPTLSVPGGTGAWTFTLSDLSDGKSAFGTKTYAETGNSARVPLAAGLQQGHVYSWKAESSGQQSVGGSFNVDLQMPGVQQLDSVGGVNVGLSSGEASIAWSSHSMGAVPGSVGFGLQFQASNPSEPGMPAGWSLQAASSSEYQRVVVSEDGSVGLVSTNGMVSNYREGAGGSFTPVQLGKSDVSTNGLAPVLIKNADGTFSVTTKSSTSVFTLDGNTNVAYLSSISSEGNPVLGQKWSEGRIQSVSDPVSGRDISFVYGGGSCPKVAAGFVGAPKGMLCQVKFWDGSTSAISYVAIPGGGESIGRITDYPEAKGDGASVFDIAYDASGRVARTRSPLVAAAAASKVIGADDSEFWTQLTYTPEGKVQAITEPASAAGATRCTRTYDYESAQSTNVVDSCFGGRIMSVLFDPTTFFTLSATNSAGLTLTNNWDLASGQLLSSTDYSGLTTVNRYEGGDIVQTWGPTKGPTSDAQSTLRQYDQSFAQSADGIAMVGLDATYWPSETNAGSGGVQELGPQVDGVLAPSLTVNWPKSPAGNGGGWSGLLTGALDVKTEGNYRIASGNSNARVRVNNILCVDGACDALPLSKGLNSIRVDLSSSTSESSMDVTWSGPDTGGGSVSIPTSALRPQYGYITTTKVNDPNASNALAENVSKSSYDAPASGRISSRVNQAGSKVTFAYEGSKSGNGAWERQTAVTSPTGASYTYTYWGDKESAKSSCPGAKSANQGGGSKSVIAPGVDGGNGPTSTKWFDNAGRVTATEAPGGVVGCVSFGAGGQVVSTEMIGMGTTPKVVTNYAVGGNPLVSESTETIGTTSTTTRIEKDLLARVVRVVDRFGIETRYTFDVRTGNIATETTTAVGASPTVQASAYNAQGWLSSISVDGTIVATLAYNEDGTVSSVEYGNRVATKATYDAQNRLVAYQSSSPSGAFIDSRVISSGGNISSETLTAPSGSSSFAYTHDSNGRLSAASVTAGLVPSAKSWNWTFDDSSNRLTQRVVTDGTLSGDFTYEYNSASQLVATNDPSGSSGLEYDDRGNAIKVGPDSFTYDSANRLISASDGSVSVVYTLDVDGGVIAKTTSGGADAGTIQYSASGVLLDADAKPTSQQISLPGGVTMTKPEIGGVVNAHWQHTTIAGNLFFETDSTGTLVGTAQAFDPYGQVLTTPNSAQPKLPNTTFQAVTGNETESLETGYQRMGARVYIPALGRFAQLDPVVGGSANGYDYANQDPVNNIDPTGNQSENWLWSGISAVAAFGVAALVAPARGALVGMLVGAVAGAAVAGAVHGIEFLVTGQTEFSAVRLGLSILAGVNGGGIFGRVKWSKAQNRAAGNINGQPPAAAAGVAPPAQPPALPRTNLGPYQARYDEYYARSLAQQNQQANPLLTGQLLFGIVQTNTAQGAAQAALRADRFAMAAVGRAQQRAAAIAAARAQRQMAAVGRSTIGSSNAANSVRGSGDVGSVFSAFD